jgi:DNA-binding IclR family transcriptional regulator
MSKQPQGIQSADAALRILEVLADSAQPLTLTELAHEIGMTVSNTHRYLVSLSRGGMIRQQGDSSRYYLGPFALRVGLAALRRADGFEAVSQAMIEVRDEINMPVFMSVWTPEGPTMVRWLEASHPITVNVKPGSRAPLLSGASGRVFLTYEQEERVAPLIAKELPNARDRTGRPLTMADVEALRDTVRLHGVANVVGERAHGVNGVSAPVFDAFGAIAFTITSVGLEAQFDPTLDGVFATAVKAAALRASREMGYEPASAAAFAAIR